MQRIISQIPQLQKFLQNLSKKDQVSTIKKILRLGLEALRPSSAKQNQNSSASITAEINLIKQNLQELNQKIKLKCNHCGCLQEQQYQASAGAKRQSPFKDSRQGYINNTNKSFSFEPPRDTIRKEGTQFRETTLKPRKVDAQNQTNYNPFSKNKQIERNLDDTQVRQALRFPPSMMNDKHHPLKRDSKDYKKHIYQQQINKEQLLKLRQQRADSEDHYKRDRFISDYTNTSSKIKKLLDQDRIRYYQKQKEQQFREGFNKYQYSDQNQMEQESSIDQQSQRIGKNTNIPNQSAQDQRFQSSSKASSRKRQKNRQKTSENKQQKFLKQAKKQMSKFESSQGQKNSKQKTHSKQSSHGASNKIYPSSQKQGEKYQQGAPEQIDEDEVISNSSSFSQFSISQSRKRNIGKISRRSNND